MKKFIVIILSISALVVNVNAEKGLLILTSDEIYTGLKNDLTNFIAHKETMGFNVFTATVENAIAEYPYSTYPELYDSTVVQDKADQIRAFLRVAYTNMGFQYLLLIGNPDPDDFTQADDTVGDVPMKMTYALGVSGSASIWHVPSDCYYRNLSSDWDKNNNGAFAEWNGDRGTGGMTLDPCELTVGRIPCYSSADHPITASILQKVINYETANPTNYYSWRAKAFQPNPIDWSDSYGAEGNVSPIYMAENLRSNYFKPYGINSTRLYEDTYGQDPYFYSTNNLVPPNRGYSCFTHYYSSKRFKGLFNSSSDNWTDYDNGIDELTDNSFASQYTNSFDQNNWLQFRTAWDSIWTYAPARIELYAPAVSNLPGKISITMGVNGNMSGNPAEFEVVRDENVHSKAFWDAASGCYMVRYDYTNNTLTRCGKRKYIRVKYIGETSQQVILSEFKAYSRQHLDIKNTVMNLWTNQAFGNVVFVTHGSQTSASSIMNNTETIKLNDSRPAFIFSKACQNAWAENANNLAYSWLKHGGIGVLAATRTSWGFSEHGHMMLYKHISNNDTHGDALRLVGEELEAVNYYGWDGNYSDVFRFNLYGDPTVRQNITCPLLSDMWINGKHKPSVTNHNIIVSFDYFTNHFPITEMRIANDPEALSTSVWAGCVNQTNWSLVPDFGKQHTVFAEFKNTKGIRSIKNEQVNLIPEPVGIWIIGLLVMHCVMRIRRSA